MKCITNAPGCIGNGIETATKWHDEDGKSTNLCTEEFEHKNLYVHEKYPIITLRI